MFDDRQANGQYAVIFRPGEPIGRIDTLTPAEASRLVGGFATQLVWGRKYVVYVSNAANAHFLEPNRLFDSHVINGLMVVMGLDRPFASRQAVELAHDCPWVMTRLEVSNL
ncbi:MAG TPA: hypothetical protein PKZ40_03740 [Anaerolineaceae bacterium]|nr:hypothetical protein [Clostridia bacterium]HPK26835.1 hypothetical protein [Anaerolineaceae bacterium]